MAEDIDTLELPDEISSARRLPSMGGDASAIMGGMADIKSRETDEKTRVFGETERRMEEDRGRMMTAMAASGREVEKLQPWNHDEESRKRTADPLEAFGSLGSVFGILASAFTRAPMENALNASAAAMNAVKAANDDDYKKAYTSWKDNMALVEKRHNMIQAQFNDAQALFRTDMAAGTVKAQNIATRFGDEQSLFLLDNGMNKEFFELQAQRATAMERMSEATRKIDENTFRRKTFENIVKELPEEKRNDPMTQMRAWNYAHGISSKTEEDVMMQWWADHPGASAEDAAKFAAKYKADQKAAEGFSTPDRMDAKEIERRRDQYVAEGMKPNEAYDKASGEVRKIAAANKLNVDQRWLEQYHAENPEATAEETAAAFAKFKRDQKPAGTAGGNVNLTGDRQRAQDVAVERERLKAEKREDGTPMWSATEIAEKAAAFESKLKATASAPSGNQRDKLQGMIDQTKYFEGHMDAAERLLLKHNAISGLGGKITRPAEVLTNIFGGNETDRKQFEREVLGMQELAGRMLTGSAGRPLAAEASKISGIVAGLNMGDTGANVWRAYQELRPLVKKIREDLASRKGEPGAAGSNPPPAGGAKPKWMDAPVIGPKAGYAPQENGSELNPITMSDETPDGINGGQQYAQASGPIVISVQGGGKYSVIDIRTGQVRYTGSLEGARQAQAQLMSRR